MTRSAYAQERKIGISLKSGNPVAGDQPGKAIKKEDPQVPNQQPAVQAGGELLIVGVVGIDPRPDPPRGGPDQKGHSQNQNLRRLRTRRCTPSAPLMVLGFSLLRLLPEHRSDAAGKPANDHPQERYCEHRIEIEPQPTPKAKNRCVRSPPSCERL